MPHCTPEAGENLNCRTSKVGVPGLRAMIAAVSLSDGSERWSAPRRPGPVAFRCSEVSKEQAPHPLNAICPYFTMFPLSFPLGVLKRHAKKGDRVLDPFCGRGTTNFAARSLGLETIGIDSSPVAHSIAAGKLVNVEPAEVLGLASEILSAPGEPQSVPDDEFWQLAYHRRVLTDLCRLREALLKEAETDAHTALRAVVLGALHGPRQKRFPSYFSNQCPRTYSPKPRYATKFWKTHELTPEPVDVLSIIERKVRRCFVGLSHAKGHIILGDSRKTSLVEQLPKVDWVITSPPYYGMKTYVSDHWLRHWFVGGPPTVDYAADRQLGHSAPEVFAEELRIVWRNVGLTSHEGTRLVIRFGGINDRRADPKEIIKSSLDGTNWSIQALRPAGTADQGKRQADQFMRAKASPICEYDIWAVWKG